MRKFLILFVVWVLAFGRSEAATVEELKTSIQGRENEIRAIEIEIEGYQKEIDAALSQANTLKNEIKRLDAVLKQLDAQTRLTQRKITASELLIQKLSFDLASTSKKADLKEASLAAVLRTLYEFESDSLVELLLKYEELSDFFGNVEKLHSLEGAVEAELTELKELKVELEERKGEESTTRNQLQDLILELKDRRNVQESVKGEKTKFLTLTKNREVEYQKLVRERERKRAEIVEEIRQREDELRLLIDPSSLPSPRPGVLGWPVSLPKVTQNFGKTSFARNSDVYGNGTHNGIDLRAPVGTPIFAAEAGKVKATGNTDNICPGGSYGKWLLIEHPSRLATLYAHLALIRVRTGDEVKRAGLIGYGGDTGYTTGPHLHFTVYDARTVELRKSRVCGTLPYGGYLDPLIYL